MKTRFLLARHEKHGKGGMPKNVICRPAKERARKRGTRLAARGYRIDGWVSSPLGRCLSTGMETLVGYSLQIGVSMPNAIAIEEHLGDGGCGNADYPVMMDRIKTACNADYGEVNNLNFAKTVKAMAHVDKYVCLGMHARAQNGVDVLQRLTKSHQGRTILVMSHGGTRIEIMLRLIESLRDRRVNVLDYVDLIFAPGDIAEVTYDSDEDTWSWSKLTLAI